MILARSVQSFYDSHKDELLKIVYRSQQKPTTHAELSLVEDIIDEQGRRLYRWQNDNDIPLERYGKLLEFMQFMAKGLTAQEDETLDGLIENALEDGLKNEKKKSAVAIGACIEERKRRRKLSIHTELLYNYIAVQIVREDEQPDTFDNDIHLEKVEMLKRFSANGIASFFFTSPELKRLRDLLQMSKEDWERYTHEYQIQAQRFSQLVETIASVRTSKKPEMISVK